MGCDMEYDKSFYMRILENLNVGVFVLDAEGKYLFTNATYRGLFGKTKEYFLDMSIPKFKDMRYLSVSVWEQVVAMRAPVVAKITIVNREFNRIFHHFTSAVPSFDSDGNIKYIVYLVEPLENITKRLQLGALNKQYCVELGDFAVVYSNDIVAESPQMKRLLELLASVAKTDASLLFTAPTGSGKQVLAEYAHSVSNRSDEPFVSIDCTAIPENLLESELFGYEKGAFTGASASGKKGQIEMANDGTLFLDEINSMPRELQGKLLRVLETKSVKRIGSNEIIPIDFRLMCASNESLEELTQTGQFRLDLYYRISVVPIRIPPLKERKEDIEELTFRFLQLFCNKYARIKILSEKVLDILKEYDWPGNVRELKNFIERLVVTSPAADVDIDSLPIWMIQNNVSTHELPEPSAALSIPSFSYSADFSFRSYMEECEKKLLQDALTTFKTPAKAAEVLRLDLSNVYRKMKKYNL